MKAFKNAMAALDFFRGRKRAYQRALLSHEGQQVLIDLAEFCRAAEPCWDADPRRHALLEGRREVWLRIQNHLNLSGEELYSLYTGRTVPTPTELLENSDA